MEKKTKMFLYNSSVIYVNLFATALTYQGRDEPPVDELNLKPYRILDLM